jgi:SMP-30/Gluconolactonase/LRE-like region
MSDSRAAVERIATDYRVAEGPVWFGDHHCLLWSDIPSNRMLRWDEATGAVTVFRSPSNYANGHSRDRHGRLVSCEHLTRPAPSAPTFPVAFQINGIAFDGISTLYTTNLSTGELLGVRIRLDGSAAPASVIDLDRDLVVPDGIRMLDPAQLLLTELVGRLTLVNVHTGATTVASEPLDQPTSVVRVGGSLWVSEGQTLRLVLGQPPNLPFTGSL